MRRFTILAAALAIAASAAPAGAQGITGASAARTTAMAGPGGCEGFNAALTQAVATQIRAGKHAEAGRLIRLFQVCGR